MVLSLVVIVLIPALGALMYVRKVKAESAELLETRKAKFSRKKLYSKLDTVEELKKRMGTYKNVPGKACLVTGGTGFVGQYLVDTLLRLHCKVTVLDIREPLHPKDGVEYVVGDLRDMDVCEKAVKGSDYVFHCATPSPFSTNRDLLFGVNVTGTQNLME